jgi:hypothetical protein
MQREDGAKKVRRGMAGVLRDGRHPGGRAYGYRPSLGNKGALEIVEERQPSSAGFSQPTQQEKHHGRSPSH